MSRQVIQIPPDSVLFAGQQQQFDQYGYAPAVRNGNTLFLSGQTALRADGSFPDDIAEQTNDAFQHVFEILRWVGLSPSDLVEVHSFHVDLPATFDQFVEVKKRLLPSNSAAWTATGVAALGLPGLKVEVKCVASFD